MVGKTDMSPDEIERLAFWYDARGYYLTISWSDQQYNVVSRKGNFCFEERMVRSVIRRWNNLSGGFNYAELYWQNHNAKLDDIVSRGKEIESAVGQQAARYDIAQESERQRLGIRAKAAENVAIGHF